MHRFNRSRRTAWAAFAAASAVVLSFGPGATSAAQYTMKIGSPTVHSALEMWSAMVKKGVEAGSHGAISVGIYPASQLGAIPRMVEGAQLGTIEAVQVPPEFLSGVDPRFGIFSVPGVITGMWQGYHALNDPAFKKAFWPIAESKGIKIVGHDCDGPGDYATRNPIRKIADFKGLKLRVFGSPVERESLRRLGATGVPMPLGEVLPAIQRRTIDGNKAGITVFVPFKYYDTVKYVLRPKQSMICVLKFVSKQWFDSLPQNLQTVVWNVTQKADKDVMPRAVKIVQDDYKAWTAHGGVLTHFSHNEQARFYKLLDGVGEQVFKGQPKTLALLALLKKVAVKYKNTPSGM